MSFCLEQEYEAMEISAVASFASEELINIVYVYYLGHTALLIQKDINETKHL